jgi:hypothetical protein
MNKFSKLDAILNSRKDKISILLKHSWPKVHASDNTGGYFVLKACPKKCGGRQGSSASLFPLRNRRIDGRL